MLLPNNELMDMEDIVFKTGLSMEEIEKSFTGMDYFAVLMDSLKEALLFSRPENNCQEHLKNSKRTQRKLQ